MALEFDISRDTFTMLCDIANRFNIKNIHTSDGCISTEKYTVSYDDVRSSLIDSQMTNGMINRYSQAVYQALPSEQVYWSLHIDKWKAKNNLRMFSVNDAIVFLTVNECQLGLIPDALTVYRSLHDLMDGKKYGSIDCDADSFGVGMKCIYVMLAGLSCDITYDYTKNYIYQQFMIDVRELADKFNPEIM